MESCPVMFEKYDGKRHMRVTLCGECKSECCLSCLEKTLEKCGTQCGQCNKRYDIGVLARVLTREKLNRLFWPSVAKEERTLLDSKMPVFARMAKRHAAIEEDDALRPSLKRSRLESLYEAEDPLTGGVQSEHEPVERVGPCSRGRCIGVVEKTTLSCTSCGVLHCAACLKPQGADHACAEADVATVTAMAENTRKCPRCQISIYRTWGCPQMFCTQCHVLFDWNTGEETSERNSMHNPYHEEWQTRRRQPERGLSVEDVYTHILFNVRDAPMRLVGAIHGILRTEDQLQRSVNAFEEKHATARAAVEYCLERISSQDLSKVMLREVKRHEGHELYRKTITTYLRTVVRLGTKYTSDHDADAFMAGYEAAHAEFSSTMTAAEKSLPYFL